MQIYLSFILEKPKKNHLSEVHMPKKQFFIKLLNTMNSCETIKQIKNVLTS